METKYKIGDKVVCIEDTIYVKKGEIGVVTCINEDGTINIREIDKNPTNFMGLQAECFDLISEPTKKVIITTDGKITTAKLYENNKEVKKATAICNSEDKFDFNTGAGIAFDRLILHMPVPVIITEPKEHKRLNGKFKCVRRNECLLGCGLTVGKIYNIIDGKLMSDRYDVLSNMCSIDDLQYTGFDFKEIIDCNSCEEEMPHRRAKK